jgi:hypothetical protein
VGLVCAYEQLRRERPSWRGNVPAGDLGCGFLIQAGLATWMQAWLRRTHPSAAPCPTPAWATGQLTRRVAGPVTLPANLQGALTRLLAGMVLLSA